MDHFGTQLTAAAALSFILQIVKQSKWFPFITTESAKINRIVAIVASGLVSIGIHWQWGAAGPGTVLISGLTWATLSTGGWHWFTQFALTHGWYKATQ